MITAEKEMLIKSQALYDSKPSNDYFLDEVLKDKKYKPFVESTINIHFKVSKFKPQTKKFNLQLGKAMIPFIDDYVSMYVLRHITRTNLLVRFVKEYWASKNDYQSIMDELDKLLWKPEVIKPEVIKPKIIEEKIIIKPEVIKPKIIEEKEVCIKNCKSIKFGFCFCRDKNNNYFQ